MCAAFSDDDVGKTVVNASGEEVGMVTAVEHGTARVKPDPGITDSIKATLGWEGTSEDTYPLQEDAVDHVTSNEIRLTGDVHEGSTSGTLDSERTGSADSTVGTGAGQSTAGVTDESGFRQDETDMDASDRGQDAESSSIGQDETDLGSSDRGRGDDTSSLDDTGHTGSREPSSEPTTGTDLGGETGSSGRDESAAPDRDVEGRGEGIGDSGGTDDRPMDEPRGDESGLMDADRDDRTDRSAGSRGQDADDEVMDPDVGDGDRVAGSDDVTSEDRDRRSRDEEDDDSSTI